MKTGKAEDGRWRTEGGRGYWGLEISNFKFWILDFSSVLGFPPFAFRLFSQAFHKLCQIG